ncbi:MAG: CinA family protein [Akkermansia sp.]
MSTLQQQAQATVEALRRAHLVAAAAESCTGGLIAATITGVPGASSVFRYGWVTYCNEAKERLLGVPASLIEQFTVVSEPVAAAMAEGALRVSGADLAVAVTGNAGPTAAEGEPPVGTVCIALARHGASTHAETLFRPDLERNSLRDLVCLRALRLLQSAALPR